jgi:predicted DsbA family dithiol-disulfide isomerase
MAASVRYYTDPACPWSWATEPAVRRLMVEFGDDLSWTYVMGGLARDFTAGFEDHEAGIGGSEPVYPGLMRHWLDVAAATKMPFDPRIWSQGPIRSTYPACIAVKAASEQGNAAGYRYLRALHEGLMCFRRKLDTPEALVEEARRAGLDVERFRLDLNSNAILEAFGNDLEEVRDPPDEAREQGAVRSTGGPERVTLPSMVFTGEDGAQHAVWGPAPYERYAEAAEAAGARRSGERPAPLEALRRFGPMATEEVAVVCGLPGPRAGAELWRLASEWEVRSTPVLTGELWEPA